MSTGQTVVHRGCLSGRNANLVEAAYDIASCPHIRFTGLPGLGNYGSPVGAEPAPAGVVGQCRNGTTAQRRVHEIEAFAGPIT